MDEKKYICKICKKEVDMTWGNGYCAMCLAKKDVAYAERVRKQYESKTLQCPHCGMDINIELK